MARTRRRPAVFVAVAMFVLVTAADGRTTRSPVAAFDDTACWVDAPAGLSMRCGWVRVPERRGHGGRTISLAVAVLSAGPTVPSSDTAPTILLAGGPGQGAIDTILNTFAEVDRYHREPPTDQVGLAILADVSAALDEWRRSMERRPLVLLDQRGTGHSEPSMECTESDLVACRARLVNNGADLAGYTTEENADDVAAVATALGHEKVNLDGGSYGTRLGLEVLRRHGDIVRAAVLESVAPPQLSMDVEAVRHYGQNLSRLFDACAADPGCATAHPALESTFYRAVADLDANPLAGEAFTGQDLRRTVWNGLYDWRVIPWLPGLITAAERRDTAVVSEFLRRTSQPANDGLADGMRWSIECSGTEAVTLTDLQAAGGDLRPAIRDAVVADFAGMLATCQTWNVPAADAVSRRPVVSDRPVLLLSGEFDSGTPREYAEEAARTLSHATSVVLPGLGHTSGYFTPCGQQLRQRFLDAPDAPLGATCPRTPFAWQA